MKNTVLFALMILAALPASAQTTENPNFSMNSETTTLLAHEYAAGVDGLLRDAHASLQDISERVASGALTPEHGRDLKLAVTREMISRLDAIAAIYDARLHLNDEVRCGSGLAAAGSCTADDADHVTGKVNSTVSVEKLRRERDAAVVLPPSAEVTR
jgi:hypothetical protein